MSTMLMWSLHYHCWNNSNLSYSNSWNCLPPKVQRWQFAVLAYHWTRPRNKFHPIPLYSGKINQEASWKSEGGPVLRTWDLQTLQCDGPPQQSTLSVTQTMVGLFSHRRTSVPAICLHTPTVQTLCHANSHITEANPQPTHCRTRPNS